MQLRMKMKRFFKFAFISVMLLAVGVLMYALLYPTPYRCVDSGGVYDGKGGCLCKFYTEDGFCLSSPYSETFVNERQMTPQIFIQRHGINKHMLIDSIPIETAKIHNEIIGENRVFRGAFDSYFDNIIVTDIGLAISIPDFPENIPDKWTYDNCSFEKVPLYELAVITDKEIHAFRSTCAGGKIQTSYTIQYGARLVSFTIHSPTELLKAKKPITYNNTQFLEK